MSERNRFDYTMTENSFEVFGNSESKFTFQDAENGKREQSKKNW